MATAAMVCGTFLLYQNCAQDATGFGTSLNPASGTANSSSSSYGDPNLLNVSDVAVNEGTTATLTVSLSFSSTSTQVFQYRTIDGSAIAGTNYLSAAGTLTFAAGETSKTISITTYDDGLAKGAIYFSVSFGQFDSGTNYRNITVTLTDIAAAAVATASNASLAGGFFHTCGVSTAGAAACWGYNGYGQIGNATTTDTVYPQYVAGLTDSVTAVTAGAHHSCAIRSGLLYCWGFNGSGQLGDATTTTSVSAKQVSGLGSVTAAAAGAQYTCAIQSGALYCWGYNGYGQMGNGTVTSSVTPQLVTNLSSGVTQVSTGNSHTCAIKSGALYCWGFNGSGQIGDGGTSNQVVPVLVSGLESGVTAVSAGLDHTCAIQSASLKCWGSNAYGQLGNGSQVGSFTPYTLGIYDAQDVAVTLYTTCVTSTSGVMKCWGYNGYGEVGASQTYGSLLSPNLVFSSGSTAMSRGHGYHVCGTSSGTMSCWGYNYYGQLGNGSKSNINAPVAIHF